LAKDRTKLFSWVASALVSLALLMVLSWLWQDKDAELRQTLRMVPGKLDSDADIDRFLRQNYPMGDVDAMIRIRTGIYLQSLEFKNDTDVKITGYIWQAYKDGTNDRYLPAEGEAGFILPDQVDAGDALQPRLDYHIHQGDEELFGWYVEATLREAFDYIKFPFDHKIVSVRIWPRDFTTNVIPVPDFDAYEAQTSDIFGIKEGIVIPRWTPESTFFNYEKSSYSTNFGIFDFVIGVGFPELHYNFVLERNLLDALVEYILILSVIALLLFVTMLIISNDPRQAEAHGFDTATIIASCSALFFVAILSHIELRGRFPGTAIVFLEYFYYLTYVALVLVTLNAYLFSLREYRSIKLIHYQDNLLPKVLFWPLILGTSVIISLAAL
jgi:hypothetical protein